MAEESNATGLFGRVVEDISKKLGGALKGQSGTVPFAFQLDSNGYWVYEEVVPSLGGSKISFTVTITSPSSTYTVIIASSGRGQSPSSFYQVFTGVKAGQVCAGNVPTQPVTTAIGTIIQGSPGLNGTGTITWQY